MQNAQIEHFKRWQNRSLGVFGDNEEGLLKALAYVKGKAPP